MSPLHMEVDGSLLLHKPRMLDLSLMTPIVYLVRTYEVPQVWHTKTCTR